MAQSIFDIFPECFDTAQPFIILGTPIFRRRTGGLTAYCNTTPLYADHRLTGTTIMKNVEGRIRTNQFSAFNINISQDVLFSRDPVFVSPSNDIFLSFHSHTRNTANSSIDSWTYDPSESTILKVYVDMNFTRLLLIVDLINNARLGHRRDRKDLIQLSYKDDGICLSTAELFSQNPYILFVLHLHSHASHMEFNWKSPFSPLFLIRRHSSSCARKY